MTQMRAKIVNRRMLNGIADKLGINEQLDLGNNQRNANMGGNALESVVGALFIDKGYIRTKTVVIREDPYSFYSPRGARSIRAKL